MPTWPQDPGIYKFVNPEGTILYVGKAKNLKKRLMSYFGNRKDRRQKTKALVRNAHHVEYTIVETEQDALLLESTLIKRYQPRYNVQLKDGKSYPYICIKNERFPRVFITRKIVRDGSDYFGPYASKNRVYTILDLIKNLFPLRNCTFNLSEDNINNGKFKVCLEYHIKNCKGACARHESEMAYNRKISEIKNLLKGNFASVRALLKEEMQEFAADLEFEKAQEHKIKLDALEDYQGKSTVVNPKIQDVDVFSIETDEKLAYVNYLKVVNGAIINTYTLEMSPNLNDQKVDLLTFAMQTLREKFHSIAPEILVPFEVKFPDENVEVVVPKIGDKRKLVDLSLKNVTYFKLQKQKQELAKMGKQQSSERILITMKKDLQMSELPRHIECFDNSNIQGSHPVSSCVVFRDAKPSKKEYRHFHVKTVVGPNDFASMEEVVFRRYKRMLAEGKSLPNLIVIDGGKGQLSSAVKSLKALGILEQVTIIGIAKKLEELFYPNDNVPLFLNKRSESLKVIQQARDEAHRFAIIFHRQLRSIDMIQTELTKIDGIGEKTADKLLTHFGSVEKVKTALYSELQEVVGKSSATKVLNYYKID
ncbi:MAG: excinuclease ABC subunit C [Saprospiraceae bacterium]|jgi:excinuclease ABC subunit C